MIPSLITAVFVIVSVTFNFCNKTLHGSYWHYLSLHSLLFMLISQCRVLGQTDIFPLLFADSRGTWSLMSGGGNFEVWRRMQLPNDGQLSSCLWQDRLPPLLLLATLGTALPCFPPSLPLQVSPAVDLMPWHSPLWANAFLRPRSCPSPTMRLPLHIPPLPPLSPTLTTTAPLFIPPGVNQIPFSSPSLRRHTQQTLSRKCWEEIYRQSFYLETNRREISVALSWNMPDLDGIFRCQNLTSLYQACTNCKDSNA